MSTDEEKAREIAFAPAWYDGKTMEREFLVDLISSAISKAREQERERCAKIAKENT